MSDSGDRSYPHGDDPPPPESRRLAPDRAAHPGRGGSTPSVWFTGAAQRILGRAGTGRPTPTPSAGASRGRSRARWTSRGSRSCSQSSGSQRPT